MITQYLAKLKATRLIKEQHKLYNTLIANENIKNPLLKVYQLEDIKNQKHKLRLANQALRKAFSITDPSTKLPEAGGILIYLDTPTIPYITYVPQKITTIPPSSHSFKKAAYVARLNNLKKENEKLSTLLNFTVKSDDLGIKSLFDKAVHFDALRLYKRNEYLLKGLEAIATYFKKDITIIKPKGEIWKIT